MKLRISNFKFQKAGDKKTKPLEILNVKSRRAFTLIEIMIVVGIIGLIAAMGVPSLIKALQKEGMRKAVSDIVEVCASARAKAVFSNQTVAVVFHPVDRTFASEGGNPGKGSTYVTSSKLPDGVELAMLDINMLDYGASDTAKVRFFPDGTSDEMTLVLHDKTSWEKITLEFSTGFTTVSDVDK
jgi:prepilin-type N-terminal cleavage/methylation domain-containing protein